MTFNKKMFLSSCFVMVLQSTVLRAEQVQLYEQPPTADEMGEVLFGHASETKPAIKMRSINLLKKSPGNTKTQEQELVAHASAELKSIGLPIKFANGSEEILSESIPFLNELGKMLMLEEYAKRSLIIEGHTDSAGPETYNLELSQRRANAVGRYLTQHAGVSANRLTAKGLGESKPLPGHKPEDEANRRVQFYSAN